MTDMLEEGDPRHGLSGYKNYGCRCDICRRANADYQLEYKARDPEKYNRQNRLRAAAKREDPERAPSRPRPSQSVGYSAAEVYEILKPIVDERGWRWFSFDAGKDEAGIKRMLTQQRFISQGIVEEIIDNLQMPHLLQVLTLVPNPWHDRSNNGCNED